MTHRCPWLATVAVVSLTVSAPVAVAASRSLTFEDRVIAQRAIEEVYWRHRIWPAGNANPKPALDAVMSDGAIRAKVEEYLKESNALESLWHRPVTAEQLQAELDRMARGTKDPDTLREIFAALHDDPFLIAECLARPLLADRLIHNWYAWDQRLHEGVRRLAADALAKSPSPGAMPSLGGRYEVLTWRLGGNDLALDTREESAPVDRLDAVAWQARLDRLGVDFGLGDASADTALDRIPFLRVSALRESAEAFYATSVIRKTSDEIQVATTSWSKQPFGSWWGAVSATTSSELAPVAGVYRSPVPAAGGCANDTWGATLKDDPQSRVDHVAVWTGSEMLVWSGDGEQNIGNRYDPSTDTWRIMSVVNSPSARTRPLGVWTGTDLVVWGGSIASTSTNLTTGGRYNPTTDTWTPTATAGAPSGRLGPTAVWTGSVMIVWGGSGTNTGGRYNPVTDTWTPTSTTAAPGGRSNHAAVWTGTQMLVYGGQINSDGGRYDPASDTWTAMSTTGSPGPRELPTAVWTGSVMIVWGGANFSGAGQWFSSGGRYNPTTDTWAFVSQTNVPSGRFTHTAVWTGSRMIVWGGKTNFPVNTGGQYDPVADAWTATTTVNAPSARDRAAAVWTGQLMIVSGGAGSTGGRYDPISDSWTPTGVGTVPSVRQKHTAVWTGGEMIVWGGAFPQSLNTGARYDPALDTWTATSLTGAPSARASHVAVWTGSEMIVWGGGTGNSTGARYNPASNSWVATSTVGAPSPRTEATALWTGSAVLVWGGSNGDSTGGRYNPVANAWTPTSLVDAPSNRLRHAAVWTGSEMIVWGGFTGSFNTANNTGGRYSPATDSWVPTATTGAPQARYSHSGLWTGSRMIVWGGVNSSQNTSFNDGGSYSPATNSWTPLSTAGAPPARKEHTAVWNGSEMIVWGGIDQGSLARLSSGGRYAAASDSWTPTSSVSVPRERRVHTAVWTGTQMIVWGGELNPAGELLNSGGRYCGCVATQTFYRDLDGDGFGPDSSSLTGCAGAPLPGYVAQGGDCNESDPTMYPGAPQLCDGINNNCSDPSWPAAPANEVNADADGFRICAGDCNDADATVFPGAPQLCDGTNNNCSDPTWPTVPANEADADGDGFRICANDCNDGNPAIRPNAVDVCNAIDDNCNGKVDDDALGEDTDGDTIHNACDNCPTIGNATQIDSDGDHVGNACDNCVSIANASQVDSDGDSRGNACDNCPTVPNSLQDDSDVDRVGDACDNCLFDFNSSQTDFNADGQGDVCDLDDGLIYVFGTDDENYIEWQNETGPQAWNVYTGDLATLRSTGVYTQVPGSNPLASRTCGVTDPFLLDLTLPDPGKVEFSLVSGVTNGVEGGLGTNGAGSPRPNTNPCP